MTYLRPLLKISYATEGRLWKSFSWKFRNIHRKHFQGKNLQGCNFIIKRLQTQLLSYEYCKIFKNNYFEEHFQTAASAHQTFTMVFSVKIADGQKPL